MRPILPALALCSLAWILPAGPLGQPAHAASCPAGLTLTVHPGLVHSKQKLPIAANIPRGPFKVSMPLYPGATRLSHVVASPYLQYPANPYLQTAAAEYEVAANMATVMAWYRSAFGSCGWAISFHMGAKPGPLTRGIGFTKTGNSNLTALMSFGHASSGGTYIAYAVEDITYPPRPARSYLHGTFRQVRIALQHNPSPLGTAPSYTVHITIVDRTTIAQLVKAINAIDGYHTAPAVCAGGFRAVGPAWLTFIRPSDTKGPRL